MAMTSEGPAAVAAFVGSLILWMLLLAFTGLYGAESAAVDLSGVAVLAPLHVK